MNRTTPPSDRRPDLVQSLDGVRQHVASARRNGRRIGFVPTVGALHAGHLSLLDAARKASDLVVVSIYVNPTQFEQFDDFEHYPRSLQDDLERLAGRADLVFAPDDAAIYPDGFSTYIEPPRISKRWEGEHREGHFRGVATIVLKLLLGVLPDAAFFGEKDYQQLLVVRDMVRDLNVPVDIVGCPLIREEDGLALSSRNQRLSPDERGRALSLYRSLIAARDRIGAGERDPERVVSAMTEVLERGPVDQIDYVAIVDPETLEPVDVISSPVQGLVAAYVGPVRLIDNMRFDPGISGRGPGHDATASR